MIVAAWIRPKQIAKNTGFWNLGRSPDSFDLIHRVHVLGEASVHAQNFIVDEGGNWQHVESINEFFPKTNIISLLAFIVKAINFCDGFTLVVASEQEDTLRVLDFVGQKQTNGFNAVFTSVNVVAQEKIVREWRVPSSI